MQNGRTPSGTTQHMSRLVQRTNKCTAPISKALRPISVTVSFTNFCLIRPSPDAVAVPALGRAIHQQEVHLFGINRRPRQHDTNHHYQPGKRRLETLCELLFSSRLAFPTNKDSPTLTVDREHAYLRNRSNLNCGDSGKQVRNTEGSWWTRSPPSWICVPTP